MTPIILLTALACTYSLTLLITTDKITNTIRNRVLTSITGHGTADTSISVYWCACGHGTTQLDEHLEHIHIARAGLTGRAAKIAYLITCPWCCSAWVAAPVMWSGWNFGTRAWWFIPAATLGARVVCGTWARFAAPGR